MIQEKIYLYEGNENVYLTSYVSQNSWQEEQLRPAVIICPGGAYLYLSEREAEPVALAFLNQGFQAYVLNYSVYGLPKEGADRMAPQPETSFPQPMRDIARAMELVQERAGEDKINLDQLGLCGFSAGGHNVAAYGNMWDQKDIHDHVSIDLEKLRPAFSILSYPVTNFSSMKEEYIRQADGQISEDNVKAAYAFEMACFADTGVDAQTLDKWSPALTVNDQTPASFIWATREDKLVPVSQSIEMTMALNQAGIPYESHIFSSGPHGLSLAKETTAHSKNQVNDQVAKWFPLAINWLESLGIH